MVKEYGNAPAVPTAVLMEVLRQELQVWALTGGPAGPRDGLWGVFARLCGGC